MRVEQGIFAFMFAFFAVTCVIYTYFTHWDEPAGSVALGVGALFSIAITFYLRRTARLTERRPEDDPKGSDTTVEGEYGYFSPGSKWPPLVALAASIGCFGIAIDWWIVYLDAPFAALCVIGWATEEFHD